MDLTTALSTVGIVIAAMLSTLGVVYTARAASGAQRRTVELQQNKIDAEAWRAQVDSWRSDVSTLRRQRIEDLATAHTEIQHQAVELDELRAKIAAMQAAIAQDRLHIAALTGWGETMARLLHEAGISSPPAPPLMPRSAGP